jgi:MFS superfamily sulfate permease-like transporter
MPLRRRFLPIIASLPAYQRDDLQADLVAGAIMWAVMVPVAMAYARMAGVPAQAGLSTSIASLVAYTIFGASRRICWTVPTFGDADSLIGAALHQHRRLQPQSHPRRQ